MFVDCDHLGDKVFSRLTSGFLTYVNIELVQWFSIKQSVVEILVVEFKFLAMKQGQDALRGLRYKLRMMDVFYIRSLIYLWG